MSAAFLKVLGMSVVSSLMIIAAVIVRFIFRKGPKWVICLLWAMVAVKLIIPLQLGNVSCLSVAEKVGSPNVQEVLILYSEAEQIVDTEKEVQAKDIAGAGFSEEQAVVLRRVSAVSMVWCFGAVVMLAVASSRYLQLQNAVSNSSYLGGNAYSCTETESSFIIGFVRPRIIIPAGAGPGYVQNVLKHENAHLKRGDHWWKAIGYVVLAVHWFNPLVWVAFMLFSRDIELACDERVIKDMKKDEIADYTQVLLNDKKGDPAAAGLVGFSRLAVSTRIKRALSYKKPGIIVIAVTAFVCVAVGLFFMMVTVTADRSSANTPFYTESEQDFDTGYIGVTGKWCWPCDSTNITHWYGTRVHPIVKQTDYVDHICIRAAEGDSVYAAFGGTVTFAGYDKQLGNNIAIRHDEDHEINGEIVTVYRHLETIAVKEGDIVAKGQVIGTAGSTGKDVSGPRLAFGVFADGKAVSPMCFYANKLGRVEF